MKIINDIKQVQQSQSAVVFLTVPWSHSAVAGQRRFEEFVAQVVSTSAASSVCFAILDEEVEEALSWLKSLDIPQLPAHHPLGAGSVLWLNSGALVDFDLNIDAVSQETLVIRLRQLFST